MRTIDVGILIQLISDMVQQSGVKLPPDVYQALQRAQQSETSPIAKGILASLVKNADIAHNEGIPICQDCGMAFVFLDIGQDVHFVNGDLETAIHAGVAKGYKEAYLRKSVVAEPLFNRVNTGDNTPAFIYPRIVPGETVKIKLATKGFGAENQSKVWMLVPADGIEGIKQAVVETVLVAGSDACPPLLVGVGIGGSMDTACLYAKKASVRPIDSHNPDPRYAALEDELLELVNQTGVGPQGLGGKTTALKVNIEWGPTHIGAMPVAVNLNCHAVRHVEAEL